MRRPGESPAARRTRPPEERPADLLLQADRVLRATWPKRVVVEFWAFQGGIAVWYVARFEYPGRVEVFARNTGEILARSQLGHPTTLAPMWGAQRATR